MSALGQKFHQMKVDLQREVDAKTYAGAVMKMIQYRELIEECRQDQAKGETKSITDDAFQRVELMKAEGALGGIVQELVNDPLDFAAFAYELRK